VTQEDGTALEDPRAVPNVVGGEHGEALRASEQRFAREFGRMPVGMVMTSLAADRPNAYIAVNDAFCRLTGYSRRELGGGDFLGDFHPEEQPALEALIQEVAYGGTSQIRTDTRLLRKDGEIIFVRLTGSAIQPAAGLRYLATFIEDASAAEQARVEIRRLEHELQRSRRLESLGQLVGGITHDFNNLLAVISSYAGLVRDEVSAAEATQSATRWEPVRRDVEQIEVAAERAKRLIKQLLAFARRQEARPVLLDLDRLVSDVTRLLGQVLGEHVRLVTRPDAGLWPLEADPGQLEQAIINIAVNARDAMPAGGRVTIETANIDTTASPADLPPPQPGHAGLPPGRYVQLRVSDTGAGMDAVTAEQAFEPFFTTKGGDQAAGLGLTAVRRFAALAGGQAWLASESGGGTTVTVMLPAATGSGDSLTAAMIPRQAVTADHSRTVLVVDDEAAIRDVAQRVLTRAGYRVVTAASRSQALELLGDPGELVDLILSDVVMPGMTGAAFAARAQSVRPGIEVLFMSGYEQPGPVAAGWPDSGAQFLDKPFSRATLLARVSQLLTADGAQSAGSG
jgi:PAS domain S-box-containing protein